MTTHPKPSRLASVTAVSHDEGEIHVPTQSRDTKKAQHGAVGPQDQVEDSRRSNLPPTSDCCMRRDRVDTVGSRKLLHSLHIDQMLCHELVVSVLPHNQMPSSSATLVDADVEHPPGAHVWPATDTTPATSSAKRKMTKHPELSVICPLRERERERITWRGGGLSVRW